MEPPAKSDSAESDYRYEEDACADAEEDEGH
jgi:hypothetical protein